MISKKVNIVIILLAIMLFVLTMGAFIINENSYSKNSEQLNRINEFTEIKNKNDGIITSMNSRFYYGVNKITNDIKNNVVKVSVTFKFILLLQIFLFLSFFIATRKQRKTINKATKAKSEFLSRMSHDMRTPMNAIKFTPSGGVVECNITAKRNNNGYVNNIITIRDNGIEMSEDFIKNKLFRPFEQEHSNKIKNDNGTGLGLSIVKSIIEVMDGTITCESKLGEGTTFIIQFKSKMIKGEKRTKKNGVVSLDMLSDKTVLVCEDHPLNIQIIKKLLERQKMNVVIAENGQIGVDTFINSRINQFDLIIMDIRMPIMDGLEVASKIRSSNHFDGRTIPIIAMTANAFERDINKSLEVGMNAHIAKPIDIGVLYETLAYYITNRK